MKLLNLSEAAEFLNVSRQKLSSLVKEQTVRYKTDPLDKRKKLFKLDDLRKLKEGSNGRNN